MAAGPRSGQDVPGALVAYRERVLGALLSRLPGAAGQDLDELISQYPARAGKALRPAMVLLTCSALGGAEEEAMGLAAGVEMLHDAFLVHDDISDGSRLRRGQPTLPDQVGIGLALCAGDALALEAVRALVSAGRPYRAQAAVMAEVDTAVRRTIEGQSVELGWERDGRLDVSVAGYLGMVLKKTSWYSVILPCRLGSLAAGRGSPGPRRFVRFGSLTGAVLQIGDDLLSLTADADVSGKDRGDDVLEGKRSLPVIHYLASAGGAGRRRVCDLLLRPREHRRRDDARWLVDLLQEQGSIAFARRCASDLAVAARAELAVELGDAGPSPQAELLRAVVSYLERRCA